MIFGVDSHRSSLSVAGVDELGRVQVAVSFGNQTDERDAIAIARVAAREQDKARTAGWRAGVRA